MYDLFSQRLFVPIRKCQIMFLEEMVLFVLAEAIPVLMFRKLSLD